MAGRDFLSKNNLFGAQIYKNYIPAERRVISKFFTNWGGSNLFYSQPGEGHRFFWQGKNTLCRLVDSYLLKNTRSV